MKKIEREKLIQEAKRALANPYPKENTMVYSAAVLTKKGNIYSAAQYFYDTFSLTLHGEQCALVHAAAHGEGEIVAIAITSTEKLKKGESTYPCHMCKQLLWESYRRSKIPMIIILINNHDEVKEIPLSEMISYPWPA